MSSNNFEGFFLPFKRVPENWEEAHRFLNTYFFQLNNLVNSREQGYNSSLVSPSGKQIEVGNAVYDIFKVLIDFGALPNTTSKSVAHTLSTSSTFRLFSLSLSASDPSTPSYFSLAYYSLNSGDDIRLNIDATNVIVDTNSDYSGFTNSIVQIEYYNVI